MIFPQRNLFNKSRNYRLAVLSELLAPALRGGARLAVPHKPVSSHQWKRALLVGASHIGDLLYQTCSLAQLKDGLPNCEFYYLTTESAAEVLQGNPALQEILPLRKSDRLADLKDGAWERLRALRFDAMLCTSPIRAWPELAFAFRLRIPNRVAYAHRGLSGLITHPVYPRAPQAFPAYFRELVSTLTGRAPVWALRPVAYPGVADREQADKLWCELGYKASEQVIACFIRARQPTGTWPEAWFGQVLKPVQTATGCRIVLCGSGQDRAELERLRRQYELAAELNAGFLGLRSLVVFLAKCTLTLSQDSGPRHLSNAAATPVVFVRNTWAEAIETGVYCDSETDLLPPHISRVPVEDQEEVTKLVPAAKGVEAALSLLRPS